MTGPQDPLDPELPSAWTSTSRRPASPIAS